MTEKKEIGIEKLWELLNDFEDYKEKEYGYANYDWRLHEISDGGEGVERWITAFRIDESELGAEESTAVIICKGYGFCEWLVENDKIETNNLSLKAFKNIFSGGGFVEVSDLEVLLMLLSISSSPIEDLILYLK